MSSRGVLHGAFATISAGFLLSLFSIWFPSWLVLRTELEQSQCYFGEGIFTSRFWWGADLDTPCHDRYSKSKGGGPLSTHDAYCIAKRPSAYQKEMCDVTNQAKMVSKFLLGFELVASVLCLVLILLKKNPRFSLNSEHVFAFALNICIGCSICGFVGMIWLAVLMGRSPLFSSSHIAEIDKEFNKGLPFTGDFSCAFQTPLHSPFSLFSNAPMMCVFPGPSSCCFGVAMITQSIGLGFLLRFFVDRYNMPGGAMLHGASEAATPRQEEAFLAEVSRRRRYSLYGAFRRRFAHLWWGYRMLLINVIPVCTILGNVVSWLGFNLLGVQVITIVQLSIINNKDLKLYGATDSVHVLSHVSNSTLMALNERMLRGGTESMLLEHEFVGLFQDHTAIRETVFFKDVLNVFNFSPLTSVKYFWLNGAYLMSVAVFVAVQILPVVKAVITIWFFYAPSNETTRGNYLVALDWMGKYMLASLYVMSFLALALTIHSNFIVLPINRHESFLMNIRAGMNAGNGVGSYMFVLTSILSLCVGQFMLQFHSYASFWEEDRRALESIKSTRSGEHALTLSPDLPPPTAGRPPSPAPPPPPPPVISLVPELRRMSSFGSSINLRSSLNLRLAPSVTNVLDVESPPVNSRLTEPMLRYREDVPMGNNSNPANRDNLMRAIASFGSRTALNVLAARSRGNSSADDEDDEEGEGSTSNNKGVELAKALVPFHPYVEAMCDRVHAPLQNTLLKFTPRGKMISWLLIFLVAGFMMVCQSWDLVEIHKMGVGGDFIVEPKDRYTRYSLVGLTVSVAETGINVPAIELSFLFFIMTAFMPVLTVLGLAIMWGIPLTLKQQTMLFTWLEIASAWSALDIFFISIIGILIELHDITVKILNDAVPNMAQLIPIFLPWEEAVMSAEVKLLDGFWIMLVAVVLEKIAIYAITENACAAITERRVERFLRELVKQQSPHTNASSMDITAMRQLLGDAAQGLLESEAIMAFAPMGRYTSVLFPKKIYGGIPRIWWVTVGVPLGIVADAKVVDEYARTGKWMDADELKAREAEDAEANQGREELLHMVTGRESAESVNGGGGDGELYF